MPRISLTDFVDIVVKSGTPKATKVVQIKQRQDYEPAADFYKPLREFIVGTHRKGGSRFVPAEVLAPLTDPKKLANYPAAVDGYLRWWGSKHLSWFEPPTGVFSGHGVDVAVNPELGLVVNGVPHVIKLYFKADPLSKLRVDIVTHLMEVALGSRPADAKSMAVLDVRRAKLVCSATPSPRVHAALTAELAYVAALWELL